MNNLKKFSTEADYSAATLNYPAVSWVTGTDAVHFDKTAPVPPTPTMNGDIKCTFNIDQLEVGELKQIIATSDDTGMQAFTPTQMWVDGVEVTPSDYYTFSTAGEHIVEYKLADGVISGNSFIYMYHLSNVEIGSGVTSIADCGAFYSTNLTSVTIPDSVTGIGTTAFYECSNLTSVTVEATTPPTLGEAVFDNTHISLIIYVPSQSVNAYKAASGWSDYASRIQAIP